MTFQSINIISAVQAVGFETVSITDDYNAATQKPRWSFLLRQSTPCDPHRILQGDTFQTNISTFNYVVEIINTPAKVAGSSAQHSRLSGLEYAADSLATACDEQNGDRILRIVADSVKDIVTGSVQFKCSLATSVMGVTASYTTSSSMNPLGSDLGFGNSITPVLDMLAADLIFGMANASMPSLSITALQQCHISQILTPAVLEECHNKSLTMHFTPMAGPENKWPNGTTLTAAGNYIRALLDASYADTGIWRNSSIFVSAGFLNATLNATGGSYVQKIRAGQNYSSITPTAAVISMGYTCHPQRLKSPLSFVISVLVADLILFATFWAIFTSIASALARSKAFYKQDKDVEMGSAAESLPMILRSPTAEYTEMQNAVLASTSGTLFISHRASAEELMAERGKG